MMTLILFAFILSSCKYAAFIYPNQYSGSSLPKYQCLAKYVSYAVVMIYEDNKVVNTSINEISMAKQAGIPIVDGYVAAFPQPSNPYPDPTDVVAAVSAIYGKTVNIWLDAANLKGNFLQNQNLLSGLVSKFQANGNQVGIFSSASSWAASYGNYNALSNLNLIYYGNEQSTYNDFVAFGGWNAPSMKLIKELSDACKLDVGFIYYLPK